MIPAWNIANEDCSVFHSKLLDNSIDCIITDPPYFVGFKNKIYDDSADLIHTKAPQWFKEWFRILKDNCYLYIFVGVKTMHLWIKYGIEAGFTYKNVIATRSFNNGSPTPKNSFGFQFQPILIFSKGKGKPYNDVNFFPTSKEWFKDKRNKNPKPYTYQYPNFIPTSISFATEKRSTKNLHPNEKNVKLIKFLIEISTNVNDIVLDSFAGSFSTAVACKQCNRIFYGCELDKDVYEKGLERIQS